jgi:hypothetical protein
MKGILLSSPVSWHHNPYPSFYGNKTVRHQDISAPVEKDSSAPLKKSVKSAPHFLSNKRDYLVLVPNCLFQRVPKCLGAELSFSTGAELSCFRKMRGKGYGA